MTAPLDHAGIAAWVSRPGATPAPTAAGPGDPPQMPTGPWHPRHADDPGLTRWAPNANRQHLTAATSDTDQLIAGSRADVADVHTTIARHRASLREVA